MFRIALVRGSPADLAAYARISIAFKVTRVFDVLPEPVAASGVALLERELNTHYIKDFDALDGGPTGWPRRFDVSGWGFLVALAGGEAVGATAVAIDTKGELTLAEGRADLAVLWDLRVAPEYRGRGTGTALFQAAEAWASARGCSGLQVETQNTNVPACRFYERQGCVLHEARPHAYPELPEEVQLLWRKAFAQT